jgi:hypothetical protein
MDYVLFLSLATDFALSRNVVNIIGICFERNVCAEDTVGQKQVLSPQFEQHKLTSASRRGATRMMRCNRNPLLDLAMDAIIQCFMCPSEPFSPELI